CRIDRALAARRLPIECGPAAMRAERARREDLAGAGAADLQLQAPGSKRVAKARGGTRAGERILLGIVHATSFPMLTGPRSPRRASAGSLVSAADYNPAADRGKGRMRR